MGLQLLHDIEPRGFTRRSPREEDSEGERYPVAGKKQDGSKL